MSRRQLNDALSSTVPNIEDDWRIDSWEKVMYMAGRLGMLKYPRYIQQNQTGTWSVRDHLCRTPLSTGDTGPIAIARALVILHFGKGRPHSTVQKD